MNKVILMGRLTREPEIRYSQGGSNMCIARYTLAVDRRFGKEGEQSADFIPCVAFGKSAEFAQMYLYKATKIMVTGRITTGSYVNKDGQKVYTTEVTVEDQEFCESKSANSGSAGDNSGGQQPPQQNRNQGQQRQQQQQSSSLPTDKDGFMQVPEDIADQLPFV